MKIKGTPQILGRSHVLDGMIYLVRWYVYVLLVHLQYYDDMMLSIAQHYDDMMMTC